MFFIQFLFLFINYNMEIRIYKSTLKKRMWRHSPKGYKSHRISNWKHNYEIFGDLEILYEIWETAENCDVCECLLNPIYNRQKNFKSRALDHCPKCLIPKGILCKGCNILKKLKCPCCDEYN